MDLSTSIWKYKYNRRQRQIKRQSLTSTADDKANPRFPVSTGPSEEPPPHPLPSALPLSPGQSPSGRETCLLLHRRNQGHQQEFPKVVVASASALPGNQADPRPRIPIKLHSGSSAGRNVRTSPAGRLQTFGPPNPALCLSVFPGRKQSQEVRHPQGLWFLSFK